MQPTEPAPDEPEPDEPESDDPVPELEEGWEIAAAYSSRVMATLASHVRLAVARAKRKKSWRTMVDSIVTVGDGT